MTMSTDPSPGRRLRLLFLPESGNGKASPPGPGNCKALAEGLHVLGGSKVVGTEHGHLLAVLDGLERGPHGDLGLAEADIAANESVHRGGRLHVCFYVGYGLGLVRGFVVEKGVFHFGLPRGVGPKA